MTLRSVPRPAARGLTLIEVLVVVGIIALLAALTVGGIAVFGERAKVGSTQTTLTLLDQAVDAYVSATGRPISFGDSADGEFELLLDEPNVFTVTHLLGEIGGASTVRDYVARIEPRFIFRYNEAVDFGEGLETDPEQLKPEYLRIADPADPNDPGGNDAEAFYDAEVAAELDGKFAVLDAWGTPIRAVHHGPTPRADVNGVAEVDLDEDGTLFLREGLVIGSATLNERQAMEEIYGRCRDRRVLFVSAGPDRRFGDLRADGDSDLFAATLDNVYSYEIDRTSITASGGNP